MSSCPTCGRQGECAQCCCVHLWHYGSQRAPRASVCPLCKHTDDRVAERIEQFAAAARREPDFGVFRDRDA